jgi:hypothetical protein
MFTLTPNPTFTTDVNLTVPGAAEPVKLTVTFRHKGRKSLADWIKRPKVMADAGSPVNDAQYLNEIIAGWEGPDQPYSIEALDELLDAYQPSGQELFEAYVHALTESRAKN